MVGLRCRLGALILIATHIHTMTVKPEPSAVKAEVMDSNTMNGFETPGAMRPKINIPVSVPETQLMALNSKVVGRPEEETTPSAEEAIEASMNGNDEGLSTLHPMIETIDTIPQPLMDENQKPAGARYREEKTTVKDLLIAVVTSPGHYSARDAYRATMSVDAANTHRVDVKFFVGELPDDFPFREEADQMISAEKDMVRLKGFKESYENLPSKAIGIFDWGFRAGYKNVFKIDDDTYLRVDKALEIVDANVDRPFMYAGRFENGKKATVYDTRSKWYMQDQYPHELPDYAQGSGFMLGNYALEYLSDHKDELVRYRVDDAAVPIWLKDLPLQIVYLHVDHYSHHIHPDSIWISPANAEEMLKIHNGEDFMLQICRDTCLCLQDGCSGPGWDTFMNNQYEDQIPRILL